MTPLSREEALRKIVRLCERGFQCEGTAAKDVTLKAITQIANSQLGTEPSQPEQAYKKLAEFGQEWDGEKWTFNGKD